MSRLVCVDCGYDMGDYNDDTMKIEKCPKCNSRNLQRKLFIIEKVDIHELSRGKSNKKTDKKKPQREFQAGEEFSVSRREYVEKVRLIDREHDEYFEKVTDSKTGEVIHECSEALTEHIGHGSDKRK